MLKLDGLQAYADQAETYDEAKPANPILKGISLSVGAGEIHAVMGPNGAGKSTLCHVLCGSGDYKVTSGQAMLNGQNLLDMEPEERAAAGLFLSFQYPVEIPGVPIMTFVRTAMNALRRARGEEEISSPQFLKKARAVAQTLKIAPDMLKRPMNVGFSGGEKKRLEVFQILMMEPSCLILDETDSGLDIDALRLIANNIHTLRHPERAMLVVTHYQRLLDYLKPDRVHVMADGQICASGGPELAAQLEQDGYNNIAGPRDTASRKPISA